MSAACAALTTITPASAVVASWTNLLPDFFMVAPASCTTPTPPAVRGVAHAVTPAHPPKIVAASRIATNAIGCDIFVDAGAFRLPPSVGWVERLRNPSCALAARRWVSQTLNPSYETRQK